MNVPQNLLYTKEHEWILVEGSMATVGITHFAQSELGDIVFCDITSVGKSFASGEVFGSVEAVKTVSDLFIPISGTITEFNEALGNNPELVNNDPYGQGWMVKMSISNADELSNLLSAYAYSSLIS